MEISLFKIALTFGLLFFLRLIYRYFVKSYLVLQSIKKIKGAVCVYNPLFGVYPQYEKDYYNKNDYYYTTKKLLKENKGAKFLATPFMDQITIELYDPEMVKEFIAQQKSFVKDLRIFGVVTPAVKNGLSFTEGEKWKYQKKLLSQIFHFEYMNSCIPLINQVVDGWITRYCKEPKSTVDVTNAFKMYAGEIVFNIFFGEDSFYRTPDAQKAVIVALKMMNDMLMLATDPKNFLFGPKFVNWRLGKREREYLSDNKFLNDFVSKQLQTLKKKYISEKEQGKTQQKSWKTLIECLLEEAPKSGLSEKEFEGDMLSHLLIFFLAGIDAPSNNLIMIQYFLSIHPEIQQKLRDEINEAIPLGQKVTRDHIMNLKYLNAVFKEVLRHSTDALFPRRAMEDVMIGDLKVKKDFSVIASIVGLNNNPNSFSDSEVFNPDRWLEKVEEGTNNTYAFIPFSIGQRRCIAEQLAIIESKAMTIELVRRFKMTLKQPYQLKMVQGLSYQPTETMEIIFEKL